MTKLAFFPIPTKQVRAFQNGGLDAYGKLPKKFTSDGSALPCRHCLSEIAEGDEVLVLSYRPFEEEQPYAEQGPIFLHAKKCTSHGVSDKIPEMFKSWDGILLRGYNQYDWIVYGTGQIVLPTNAESTIRKILATDGVTYVHARSATNNCYQFRVEPAH